MDSNFLYFGKLPTVDLMCSSFAGGASGFPLCFENYSEEEKKVVMTRNRDAIKATNLSNIRLAQSSFFMSYAGFFTEAKYIYNSEFWFNFTNVYIGNNVAVSTLIPLNE